jgi:RNA polymerase sigma factor (sigma-70 family)
VELEKGSVTKKFIDDMAISIRNILWDTFPGMTAEEREDVDQEVKLKIWRKISRGKKIGNLRSYLWKVTYTTALDLLQARLQLMTAEEIQERSDALFMAQMRAASPDIVVETKEMSEIIKQKVKALPPRRRQVLELWLTGMSLDDIAAFLGYSDHQARHLFYRGIDDLKAMTKEDPDRSEFPKKKAESGALKVRNEKT